MTCRVWIEPLMGKDIPVGSALIVYARDDERIYQDTLKLRIRAGRNTPLS